MWSYGDNCQIHHSQCSGLVCRWRSHFLILSLLGPPFHWANVPVIELLKEVGIDRNYISPAIFGIVIGDEPDEVIFVESIDRTF